MKKIVSGKRNTKIGILVLVIILFNFYSISAQQRINRQNIQFDQASDTLKGVISWSYNSSTGEWKSCTPNLAVDQNFDFLHFKRVSIQNSKFYVLIYEEQTGAYKYPALQLDFYLFKRLVGFIFSESEYKKLSSLQKLSELKTKNKIMITRNYGKETYDDFYFLDLIQSKILEKQNEFSTEFTFPIYVSNEGNIRFNMPDDYSLFRKYNFEERYFEVDAKNFDKLIIP